MLAGSAPARQLQTRTALPAYLLRRVIERQVENAVSQRLLAGEFAAGDTVLVDHTPDGYTVGKAEAATATTSAEPRTRCESAGWRRATAGRIHSGPSSLARPRNEASAPTRRPYRAASSCCGIQGVDERVDVQILRLLLQQVEHAALLHRVLP